MQESRKSLVNLRESQDANNLVVAKIPNLYDIPSQHMSRADRIGDRTLKSSKQGGLTSF